MVRNGPDARLTAPAECLPDLCDHGTFVQANQSLMRIRFHTQSYKAQPGGFCAPGIHALHRSRGRENSGLFTDFGVSVRRKNRLPVLRPY